jgi:hypothetical protein
MYPGRWRVRAFTKCEEKTVIHVLVLRFSYTVRYMQWSTVRGNRTR